VAGVDLAPVPYRGGGPALIDLLGGQVQVMFESVLSSIAYIRPSLVAIVYWGDVA
jgi:tripartite-type tricarboxylate transporter receptor subunit TctC